MIAAADGIDRSVIRATCKTLLNALINSSPAQMRAAEKADDLPRTWGFELPDHITPAQAIVMIRAHHEPIKNSFGRGLELQTKDAEICERILEAGIKFQKPVLPVHDSFIVKRGDREWLEKEMKAAYRSVIGQGFEASLKVVG